MRRLAILLTTVMVLSVQSVVAQEPAKVDANSELALRQGRIADKYARLEQLMLKMAEVDAGTNPQRAALLKRAVQQSKENLTRTQLESIVKRLEEGKVPLEESVAIYERGEALKRRCEELLRLAEARVEKITLDAAGKPTGTEPLDVS